MRGSEVALADGDAECGVPGGGTNDTDQAGNETDTFPPGNDTDTSPPGNETNTSAPANETSADALPPGNGTDTLLPANETDANETDANATNSTDSPETTPAGSDGGPDTTPVPCPAPAYDYDPPSVTAVVPALGPRWGGRAVTLLGSGFGPGAAEDGLGAAVDGGGECGAAAWQGDGAAVCATPAGDGVERRVILRAGGQESAAGAGARCGTSMPLPC
jgi:hypothetical protein